MLSRFGLQVCTPHAGLAVHKLTSLSRILRTCTRSSALRILGRSKRVCSHFPCSLFKCTLTNTHRWRWSLWEILWLSGPVFVLWFFFLPETSADTILLYRARRLRKMTNNSNLQSNSEIKRRHLTARQIFVDAIIKPFEIMFKDPAVLFTNVYTALIYGIYYSFFEAFALVYGPIYGFNLGTTGVAFLTVLVGALITGTGFFALLYFVVIPQMKVKGPGKQEDVLMPSLIMTFGPPIGLFLFGKLNTRSSMTFIRY